MWDMKKLAALIFSVCVLLIAGRVTSEQLNSTENLRHERVILPPSAPDPSRLPLLQTITFMDEELGPGVLVLYNDTQTKWQIDYIELYDLEGDLLAIAWIDRFGACQVAVDHGLLNPQDLRVYGILVIVPVGTML